MKRRPEDILQRQVAAFLDSNLGIGSCWFAVPNGGWRSPKEAAILAGLGVKAGAPDLLVFDRGRCFAIELKAAKGRLTDRQEAMHSALKRADVPVMVCRSLDAAIKFLESYDVRFKGRIAA